MTPVAGAKWDDAVAEKQRLVSDLFHALSQPITGLQCSLELALRERQPGGPSPENLQAALADAEQIAHLVTGIRELLEADDPGDARSALSLGTCLREAVLDMQPVAEAAHVKLQLRCNSACRITAEPHRLRQALFYLLEFGLASPAIGSVLNLDVTEQAGEAITTLTSERMHGPTTTDAAGKSQELIRRLGLAIAGRIFETAGGELQVEEDKRHLRLSLRLPLAL